MPSVLLCSTPIHGHVTPLLQVARHLSSRGDRVRFLTGSRFRELVEATGATFEPLPPEADYDDRDMNTSFPDRAGRKGAAGIRDDMLNVFVRPIRGQLSAMDRLLSVEPADVVLAESLFLAAPVMLSRPREQRPPVLNLGVVPLALKHRDVAPMGMGIPPMRGPIGRLRNAILTAVAEKVVFAPVQKEADRLAVELTGRPLGVYLLDWPSVADAVVQFTVPGFEYPRSGLPETVHFVGPVTRGARSTAVKPEWWPDLEGPRPVVHVTQGTIANKDYGALITPTIDGLADDDVLVVVSTGGPDVTTVLDGRSGPLPDNVRVATYLPYDALFPLTSVMVSNGGYGGVHYAMEYGVPLVVAGATEDKAEVSARVGWSGVGVNLKTDGPTPEQVAAGVRTVLADPRYRTASARISAEITASPGVAGLADIIDAMVLPVS